MLGMMQNFITRSPRALLAKALIFFVVVVLAGCSAARLGYSNGELLSYWWLDSYVDFGADQQPWVKQRIADLFVWHRKTQLRDYGQLLTQEQGRLRHEVSQAEVLASYDEFKMRAAALAEKALPDLADLALSLRPHQIAHIDKKFESNSETFRKDYLRGDIEQRQHFRYKKVLEQGEHWFGSFSSEQQRRIRIASDARPLNNEMWMADRLHRQRELIALLKKIQAEKPAREAVIAMIRDYMDVSYFSHSANPEFNAFFDASKGGTAGVAALIINIATPAQKVQAHKKLQQWIDDFKLLATHTT